MSSEPVSDTYADEVDVTGEVRAVDLEKHVFRLRLENQREIESELSPSHERQILRALADHDFERLRLIGRGQFQRSDSNLKRIEKIERIETLAFIEKEYGSSEPSLWEYFKHVSERIPAEALEGLPRDGSVNHDHYLYGAPKQEE